MHEPERRPTPAPHPPDMRPKTEQSAALAADVERFKRRGGKVLVVPQGATGEKPISDHDLIRKRGYAQRARSARQRYLRGRKDAQQHN